MTTAATLFSGILLGLSAGSRATSDDHGLGGRLAFVETAPIESSLDHADIRETHEVWIELIDRAETRIDLAHFYASNREGSRLEPVILALQRAARRGVSVRFLADAGFYRTYADTQDRLDAIEGIEVRRIDLKSKTGGVLHAKFMLVDEREVVVGSANFDWRALEHIQELGLHASSVPVASAFGRVFAMDWATAGNEPVPEIEGPELSFPVELDCRGGKVRVTPVFSPESLLPGGLAWDLPALVGAIDGARESVSIQLLSYGTTDREGRYFDTLEDAIRRAAARKVQVRLLLSHWSKRRWRIEGLKSLTVLPYVEVRLSEPPQASEGFIPFARVAHAKFLVADGSTAWVGTSNWSRDYFQASRNAGLLLEGEAAGEVLTRYFATGWEAPGTEPVDPGKRYEAPRIGD